MAGLLPFLFFTTHNEGLQNSGTRGELQPLPTDVTLKEEQWQQLNDWCH